MAVAAPVLERIVEEEQISAPVRVAPSMTADELHNSQMRENLAKILNPEAKMSDFSFNSPKAAAAEPVVFAEPAIEEMAAPAQPYLVQNARADADIFRADSIFNRVAAAPVVDEVEIEEEENEDLRPTPTTIQYKTAGHKTVEEGKIANTSAEKRVGLTKKQKIVIAVVVSVIITLLALIIVNSAIITNLNNDLSSLQSHLSSVKTAANNINNQISDLLESEAQRVRDFARLHDMLSPNLG